MQDLPVISQEVRPNLLKQRLRVCRKEQPIQEKIGCKLRFRVFPRELNSSCLPVIETFSMFRQGLRVQTNGPTPSRHMRLSLDHRGSVIPRKFQNAVAGPVAHQVVRELHGWWI